MKILLSFSILLSLCIPGYTVSSSTAAQANEILFLDTGVSDSDFLRKGMRPGVEVVMLEADRDGLAQMAEVLRERQNLSAVHIVSHAKPGQLLLGGRVLSLQEVEEASDMLRHLGEAFAADGDLMLYGCSLAKGENGIEFLDALSRATGADVAASTTETGSKRLGADWILEAQSGVIESSRVFTEATEQAYIAGTLAFSTGQFLTGTANTNNFSTQDVGPGGTIYGAWDYSGSGGTMKFATWNGSGWTEIPGSSMTGASVAAQLTGLNNIYQLGTDSLKVDSNGDLHLAFGLSASTGGSGSARGLAYGFFDVSTQTWTFRRIYIFVDPSGWNNISNGGALMLLDSSENPHIVFGWSDANPPRYEHIEHAFYNGTSWNVTGTTNAKDADSIDVLSGGAEIYGLDGAVDSSGNIHITYTREDANMIDGDIWYVKRTGSTWGTPAEIFNVDGSVSPTMALDADDKVHVAWTTQPTNTSFTIKIATNASGSFVSSTVATDSEAGAESQIAPYDLNLSINSAGNRFLGGSYAFYGGAPDYLLIRGGLAVYTESSPGTWVREDVLPPTTSEGNFSYTSMAVKADNTVSLLTGTRNDAYSSGNLKYAVGIPAALPSGPTNSAPSFNDGTTTNLTVNENGSATSINNLLDIADTDTGDTLTWSVTSGPSKGSLGGFNTAGTSNGGNVTPSGLTYTPTSNNIGNDNFTVQISDGTDTDSITVNVTITDVNPLITANSGSIAEDASMNDAVLTMAATGDTNGLSWSITGGNTGNAFAINSSTGAITVNSALDFETTPGYTLMVAVDDEDAGSTADDTESVTITVTNAGVQTLGSPAVSFADEDLTLENFTVPAGTDRALVVLAGNSASNDILTVSFNGQPLTEIVEQTDTTAVDSIWVRAMGSSASSTTGNIVVTRQDGAGTGKQFISAHVFEEVDQATPMGQEKSDLASGSNVGSSLTVTSIPGDIVIDLFDTAKTTSPAPSATEGAGQTLIHTQAGTVQTGTSRYSVSTKSGATSVPMSWTSTGQGMLHVAANIKQVSSLSPTTTTVAASGVSDTSAVFNATVNPNGTGTTVVFEYSENATLSSGVMTTPVQDAGSGSAVVSLLLGQGSLSPSTTYYFRAKSTNANGTTTGGILSFTTNAPSSGGPITQIGSTATSSATNDDTLENFTLAAGTNRVLIVTASHSNETNITGVSFNGQALTQVVERDDGFAVDSMWVRAMGSSSSSATGNIVVTRAGSSSGTQTILAVAYENVDQLTPMDGAQANNATGTNVGSSVTVTSETGDLVFDLFDTYKPSAPQPSITDGAGQTQLHPTVGGTLASGGEGSWGTSTEPGAPSVTMSWTSDATAIIQLAANINRAPGSSNAAPSFNDGATASLNLNENASATSINTLLDIADTDTGDTLTWSVTSGPSKGSLGGFNATGTSNGGNVTPSGLTYTPTSNNIGNDNFTVQVSDGTDTDSITVNVTISDVNPAITANSGGIAEDASMNDAVLTMAATGDTNGLSWSITGGNTGNAFAINSSTGAIRVNSGLDYETTPSYTLTIAVDDEDVDATADDTESVVITVSDVFEEAPQLGSALTAAFVGNQITFTYYLENFGDVTLSSLTVPNDLDAVLGAGNYSVGTLAFVDDPGGITLNSGFNGSASSHLITSGSLASGDIASFQLIVTVTALTDMGSGLGVYQNQVTASGTSPLSAVVSDLSDNGTDPDPNGDGDPSGAGENDVTPASVLPASIGDFVWNDLNGDGVQDGGSESGLSGVTVYLDLNTNGSLDGGEPNDTTNGAGAYELTGLLAGTYSVRVDASSVPAGFVLTGGPNPVSVTVGTGDDYNDADFGYQQQDASIGDFVWNDLNGDGVQDGGEPALSGVTVFLDLNSNGTLDGGEPSDSTDGSGAYDITGLPVGIYSVMVDTTTVPTGFTLAAGSNPLSVNLAAGEDFNSADFGFQQQDASIGDFVWNDLNGDGVQDGGETGISGVTVFLDLNTNGSYDGGEPSDVTDANGAYDLTNLPTGTYSVQVNASTLPPGVALSTSALPLSVSLAAGEDYNDGDMGYRAVPVAAFSSDTQFGCGPLTVQFTDSSLNATAWEWDFGDGFTSTDQSPEHVYDAPGVYTVVLTSQNGADSDIHQKANYIQVIGPDVGFAATPTSGNSIPHTVSFTDQTAFSSPGISWQWNFGDGNTSTAINPLHSYTQPGSFTVSLTVTDIDGCSRTLTKTDLVVITVPPAFNAAFSPGTILSGEVSTLTFTVDNTLNTAAADNLAFTVNLPAGVVIANPGNVSTTLTGGTLTGVAGSGTLTLSGASVSAGATATVQVDVTGSAQGTYVTVTGDLTSDFGNSGTAADTLVIKETPSLVVDTLQDTEDDFDGKTSLREAMTYAITLGGTPEITFSNVTTNGAVDFYDGTARTITLAGTVLPPITNPVSILGPGADVLAISGGNSSQIFLTDKDMNISDLTLTNGNTAGQGGAIAQFGGITTITRCQITNNVTNQFGGAILLEVGSMIITDSTLSGNTANGSTTGGGAIVNTGTLTIINSTLSGNSAPNASASGGGGGAIYTSGSLTLIQTTITGNRASAAAGGGGIHADGNEVLVNSIVAGNFKGVGTTPSDIEGGTINTANNNLIGDAVTAGGISDGTGGNIVGNAGTGTLDIATVLDTALADNGGPTLTHAFPPTSPALNTGDTTKALGADSNPLTLDQRGTGFSRVVGPAVDIGAFELPNSPPTLVGTAPNDGIPDQTAIEDGAPILLDLSAYFADAEQAPETLDFSVQTNTNAGLVTASIIGKDLTLTLIADQSGTADLTIRATDNGAQFKDATFTLTVNKQVDLTLTVTEDKDPVLAGNALPGNLIHQIKVMNNGPSDATNLVVDFTQTLPTGVVLDSAAPNSGTESAGTWTVPALAEGQMAILTLTMSVPGTVLGGTDTIITSGAVTSVTEPLTATGDDAATVKTSVSSPASTGFDLETSLLGNLSNSLIEQLVKVTNNNPDPVPAFRILVSGLPDGVTLFNAHGTTTADIPFIVWDQELAPGAEAEVLMQYFSNTGRANFTPVYTIEFLTAAEATALLAPPPVGDPLAVVRFLQLADESMLVEWASTPGKTYYIQYTSDMITYTTVLPGITAGATRTQWIDRGPPQTESHPSDVTGLRAYRVMEAK